MRQWQRDAQEAGSTIIVLIVVVMFIIGLGQALRDDRGDEGWTRDEYESYISEQIDGAEAGRDAGR